MTDLDRILTDHFPGYHIEIQITPGVSIMDATGCIECGGDDLAFESVSWGKNRKLKTFEDAISVLQTKLGLDKEEVNND